jgi:hypothetical protein
MDESNVMKPDTENSNLSRKSPPSDATSSSVKTVDSFAFVEVKCEVAVITVFTAYLTKLLRRQSLNGYR